MEEIRTKLDNAICRIDNMQSEINDHDGRLLERVAFQFLEPIIIFKHDFRNF